ncbi:MAG: phosphotransferase family protein [Promethearchaeota archaeon]
MVFEEENPADISISTVHKTLLEFFPNLLKEDIKFLYHGTYNVFQIKKDFIARFPDRALRNEEGSNMIMQEINTLTAIEENISDKIPKPKFYSLNVENPFMIYKKIPGISLSKCFSSIGDSKKEEIAIQIARFLSELHFLKISKFSNFKSYSIEDYRNHWIEVHTEIENEIYSKLKFEQKRWLDEFFSSFLADNENFKFKPCIAHGDFDLTNILVDPISFDVKGIIDFEETRIFDPAADFLFFNEGETFLQNILDNYKGIKEESFFNRMKFLYCRTCVPYLQFGLRFNRKNVYSEGLRKLKENMNKFPL